MQVGAEYAYSVPEQLSDLEAAPLMCAGSIGYRSLRLANVGDGQILGLAGFGGSGHLTLQLAKAVHPSLAVFVFTRSAAQREFARSLGADWAGGFDETPPARMHAIIDTTPAWDPVLRSLTHLQPGGRLVINAIRKEGRDQDSLLQLDYASHLWMEKEIRSVANVTRQDVRECLQLAASVGIRAEAQEYPLEAANTALLDLKRGGSRGSKVLRVH
jgi:alcohol dehydrogenase, propanol-preferring